jgi:glycosyltransferase involved in cell wall biosynthesis
MKVLHLAAGNLFGGVETYLLTLARLRNLCPAMEPHFALCFPGRLRDELLAVGVPVHDLGAVRASRPWTVLLARRRLKRLLRAEAIHAAVVHGTWPHAVFGPATRRARVRLVTAIHDVLDPRHWINRWAARTRPDAIVSNSRFTADAAAKVFPGTPVAIVHPPVPAAGASDPGTRERIRAEFGTPPGAVVILMVSRIEGLKGHAVLLDALGRLRGLPEWTCWVVGGVQRPDEGNLLDRLRGSAERLGVTDRVRFVGARADVPAVMAAADVYCQPNTGPEGFGLTFVEALRARVPVVTTAIGGAVEIVTGECGILVKPGDAEAVADALRELIVDAARRRALGEGGPRRAAELCDPARQLPALAAAVAPGTRP